MKQIKMGIIGAGSLGSLFGGMTSLISSGDHAMNVSMFGRKEHVNAINRNGLVIITNQKRQMCPGVKAYESLEDFEGESSSASAAKFDYLLLTTKAHDLKSAMMQYHPLISSCQTFVILQNGIGNEDLAKNYCSKEKIIRAITSNGVLMIKPGIVSHTGKGITKMGFPFKKRGENDEENLNTLGALFNRVQLQTIIATDINKECWEKAFVNIGINAIGALTRLKNGEMLKTEAIRRLMEASVEEAVSLAREMGIVLENRNYVEIMHDVARKTAENKNSMLQDILNGKKTEIDFLNGKIVELAKERGLGVPVNLLLTTLIKGLESSIFTRT